MPNDEQPTMDEILQDSALQNVVVSTVDGTPALDCEVDHPRYGFIPITLTSSEYPATYARAFALL
jgi:hypothetical protein